MDQIPVHSDNELEEIEDNNAIQMSPISSDSTDKSEKEEFEEITNEPSTIIEQSSGVNAENFNEPSPIFDNSDKDAEQKIGDVSIEPSENTEHENVRPISSPIVDRPNSSEIVEQENFGVLNESMPVVDDSNNNVEREDDGILMDPPLSNVDLHENFQLQNDDILVEQSAIVEDFGNFDEKPKTNIDNNLKQTSPIAENSCETIESSIEIFVDEQNKNQPSADEDRLSEEALDALECLNEQISEEFHLVPDVSSDHPSLDCSEKEAGSVVKARLWTGLTRKSEDINRSGISQGASSSNNKLSIEDADGTKILPRVDEILDFNLPVCKENRTSSADMIIPEFIDQIKPTVDVDEPPVYPMNECSADVIVKGERCSIDDNSMEQESASAIVLLPSNSASSSPKMSHQVEDGDDENALVMDCNDGHGSDIMAFNENIDYSQLLIDEGNDIENDMSATNALKNLHELITAVTGVDEQPSVYVTTTAASFFLPLVTSTTCSNVTVIAPASSILTAPSPKTSTSSMENIGSKLLLLAAAQSASKTSSSSVSISTEHLMPPLSVHPKPSDPSLMTTTSKVKTTRLLLPKPVSNFIDPSLTGSEVSSSSSSKTASYVPLRDSTAVSSEHFPIGVPTVASNVQIPNTKPSLMLNPSSTISSSSSQSHRLLAKILNRNSVSSYTFEPPPLYANFQIPFGGYKCIECGDQYAMKTCLEFHLQRRSLMIETTCIPCKQMFMFFNKCAYFAHIRMHRTKKWMTNVFRSVSIKPIVWKLMEQWFEDTAFNRFSDPDAFFEYEFGSNGTKRQKPNVGTEVWRNDVVTAASNGVAKMSALGGGMFTIVASSHNTIVHRCSECAVDLPDQIALKRHFMYNLPANQKQFICTACQAVYFSQCSFYAHKRTHSCASPFVCPECGETMQSSTLLSTHLLSHRCKPTVLDSWRCVKCFTFYSSWEALVIHMAAAHCEMHHCCRACTMAFSSATAFEDHKRTAHKYNAPETIEYRLLAKCCSCESLGFQGKDSLIEHLKQHFATVSPFKVYRCAMCGRLMENKSGLVSHFKNVHRITVAPTSIEEDRIVIPSSTTDTVATSMANVVAAAASTAPVQASNVPLAMTQITVPTLPHPPALKYFSCKICRNLHFRSELGLKLHIKMKHSTDSKPVTSLELKSAASVHSSSSQAYVAAPHQQPAAAATQSHQTSTSSAAAAPAPISLLSCYLCKKSFDKLESRIDDGLQHLKNGQAVCLLCQNLPMNSLSMLMRHFAKHVDEQERSGKLRDNVVFLCNRHCREEFYDRAKALNHLRSIHGQAVLVCDKCRVDFLNELDMRQHFTKFHPDEAKSLNEQGSTEHQSAAIGVKRAATEVSKFASTLAKKACIVQRTTSLGDSGVVIAVAPPPMMTTYGSYRCSKCEFKFDTREKMHRHATERHKEPKFYTCLECATNFASPPSLGRHLITAHQINDVEKYVKEFSASQPRKANELECDVCHLVLQSKLLLDSHVRTHGMLFLKTQEKRTA